jgi:hypothetical protein
LAKILPTENIGIYVGSGQVHPSVESFSTTRIPDFASRARDLAFGRYAGATPFSVLLGPTPSPSILRINFACDTGASWTYGGNGESFPRAQLSPCLFGNWISRSEASR